MADENDPNRPEEPAGPPEAALPDAERVAADPQELPVGPKPASEEDIGAIEAVAEDKVKIAEAIEAAPAAAIETAAPTFASDLQAEAVEQDIAQTDEASANSAPLAAAFAPESDPVAEELPEPVEQFVSVESQETPPSDSAERSPTEPDVAESVAEIAEPQSDISAVADVSTPPGEIQELEAPIDTDIRFATHTDDAPSEELPEAAAARELDPVQPEAALAEAPAIAEAAAENAAIPGAEEWETEQEHAQLAATAEEDSIATIEPEPEPAVTAEHTASDLDAVEPQTTDAPEFAHAEETPIPAPQEQEHVALPAAPPEAAAAELETAPEFEVVEVKTLEQESLQEEEPALEQASAEATELVSFEEEVSSEELTDEPSDAEALESQAAVAEAPAQLPPNYFQAAGDPEEPVEPPPTFWQRTRQRFEAFARVLADKTSPLAGGARKVGDGMWRGVRGIKHPRNVREAAVWSGWAAAAVAVLLVGFYFFVTWGMPSTEDIRDARNGQSITFLDRNGNVILREGAQNAPPVDLKSLPPYVAQAFVAIEDRRFYDHWGVDFEGMMRAGAQNIRAGRVVQGGSTITQQLAKNLFLTNERSWRRKAQEIALAFWLETKFSKEEILALYLSRVYFGAGAYGIEAAAERYFDRPARELTLLQSAMIAGLVKAPSRLNPASQDISSARTRAEVVLQEMVALKFISDSERRAALSEELVVSQRNPAGVLSYYRDWIDPLLNDVIGTQRDDFIIETTIDIQSQRAGAEAVEAVLAEQGESRRASQAALLSMDDEGGVLAMVGGRDYDKSQFNRATQARRQPGSSFKYFIYLAAMESGLTPWSIRNDAPITIHIEGQPDWTPGNYHEEFNGPVELARAFAQSYNMVAIRVANEVGGQHVIDVAHRLGVSSELHNYHSLALGAQEVTLLELTQSYGAMASQGYRVQAHGVSRIRRAHDDETMWSWRQTGGRTRVIEERPLRYMNYMMNRVVESGTGTAARMNGRQIGGKTGTANDYRDAWFVGFTPGIVTGVWVGNDDHRIAMARVTGGQLPAAIWARFMPTPLRNVPIRELQMPGPDDYEVGRPDPISPTLTAIGAPLGNAPPTAGPNDGEDRSLDFGPEG